MKVREIAAGLRRQGRGLPQHHVRSGDRFARAAARICGQAGGSPDQWLFLTGRLIYIRRVASELFGVALDKQTHTERLIVCDKWGKVRGVVSVEQARRDGASCGLLVDKLLAEKRAASRVGQAASCSPIGCDKLAACRYDGDSFVGRDSTLPHVNAALNALATVLLVLGYVQIKRRQERRTSGRCWPALASRWSFWRAI